MKNHAEPLGGAVILQDRGANYFGTEGAGFNLRAHLRAHLRGNGVLTLLDDRLVFDQYLTGTHIEIPLEEMSRLGVGLWHQFKSAGVPVLKVTYRGNLVFGVAVAHPERWIETIETLSGGRGHVPVVVDERSVPAPVLRRFRVMAAVILVLVLLLTVVLPILLSWVHRQGVREVEIGARRVSGGSHLVGEPIPERTGTDG